MRFKNKILFIIISILLGCQNNDSVFINMLNEMEHSVPKPNLKKFKSMSEDRAISYFHFINGQYYFNSILRQGNSNEIKLFFEKKGIFSQIEIALISFRSLHRKINNKPINLDVQIKDIKCSRNEITECEKDEERKNIKIKELFKNGDTINFCIPVEIANGLRNGIYFNCPFNYWEFDKNKDLSIQGIIIASPDTSKNSDSKIKICKINRDDTGLLSKKISIGDTIYVPLNKTIIFR